MRNIAFCALPRMYIFFISDRKMIFVANLKNENAVGLNLFILVLLIRLVQMPRTDHRYCDITKEGERTPNRSTFTKIVVDE